MIFGIFLILSALNINNNAYTDYWIHILVNSSDSHCKIDWQEAINYEVFRRETKPVLRIWDPKDGTVDNMLLLQVSEVAIQHGCVVAITSAWKVGEHRIQTDRYANSYGWPSTFQIAIYDQQQNSIYAANIFRVILNDRLKNRINKIYDHVLR